MLWLAEIKLLKNLLGVKISNSFLSFSFKETLKAVACFKTLKTDSLANRPVAWQASRLILGKPVEAHRKTRRAPLKEKRTVAIECLVTESRKKSPALLLLSGCCNLVRSGKEGERQRVGNRNYGLGIVDAFLVQSKGKNKTYFPSLSSAKRPLKRWLWTVSHQAGNQEFEDLV